MPTCVMMLWGLSGERAALDTARPAQGQGLGDKGHKWVAQRAMGYLGTVPIRLAGSCTRFLLFGFKICGK